jgi:predicted ribonuclease YlaK
LANKLSKVMDSLISYNKLVFMKGRLLVDRVVVINEVVDLARRSTKECLIFKVGFEKSL